MKIQYRRNAARPGTPGRFVSECLVIMKFTGNSGPWFSIDFAKLFWRGLAGCAMIFKPGGNLVNWRMICGDLHGDAF